MTQFMKRGLFTLGLGLVLWTAGCTGGTADQQIVKQSPNLIFIYADDLGYGDLGCYGNEVVRSPNIDRLARGGVKLTDFYVTWPACTPSRSGLLTGRYPQRNGLYDMIRNDMVNYGHQFTEEEYAFSPEMTLGMDLKEITIADLLKKAGYATGIFGKWDSGRPRRFLPQQRGFDVFYGFANTGIDYWTHERYGIPSMFRGNERVKEEGYATDLFRKEAVRFLRENHDKPFFIYLPFNAPHGGSNLSKPGVQAPDQYVQMYDDELPGSRDARHYGAITCMDDAIGEIMGVLEEYHLIENTLVVFSSDNGASGSGHNGVLRGGKGKMWEGGIRVPFIAHWPGQIPADTVSKEFLTTLEVLPTFTKLAGVEIPDSLILDGFDMLPVLKGEAKSNRTSMFWQRRANKGARVGEWKWALEEGEEGLFDLSKDVSEQNNLAEEMPEKLEEMRKHFSSWSAEMDAAEPRGPFKNY